jgi:hypothetical protein
MVSQLKNPPRTLAQHLDVLCGQDLKETAGRLEGRLQESGKAQ